TVAHHGRRDPGQTRRPRRSPALTRWTAAAMAAPQTVERSGRADWTLMTAIHDALHCDLDQLLHTTAGPAAARARWIVFRDQLHRHLAAEHAAMWRPARAKLTGDPRGQALLEAMDEEQLGVIPGRANLTGPAQEDRQGEGGRWAAFRPALIAAGSRRCAASSPARRMMRDWDRTDWGPIGAKGPGGPDPGQLSLDKRQSSVGRLYKAVRCAASG